MSACRVCLRGAAEGAARPLPSADCRRFFTQLARLQDIPEVIYLCAWCRVSVRKALILYENAMNADSLIRWIDHALSIGKTVDVNLISNAKSLQNDLHTLSRSKTQFTSTTGNTETIDNKTETGLFSGPEVDNGFSDVDDYPLSDVRMQNKNIRERDTIEKVIEGKENIVCNQQDGTTLDATYIPKPKLPGKKKKKRKRLPSDKSDKKNATNFVNDKLAKRRLKEEAKCTKMQFHVVYLSLEEQFRQIDNNKKSEKYLKARFRCEFCGIGFSTEDVHSDHMKRHDESFGQHKCDVCTLHFSTHEVLLQHVLAHRRYFQCLPCGAILRRRCHCSAHRAKCASAQYALECDYCQKVFGDSYSLKQHLNGVHLKKKDYVCNYCQKTFTHKQKLVVHMRSHTGERPFQCTHCQKKFTTNSNLKTHLDTHLSSGKQHYCVECDTYFKSAKSLRRHFEESTKHQDREKFGFACPRCNLRFLNEKRLAAHVSFIHLGRSAYKCHACSKGFASAGNLRKHTLYVHQKVKRVKDKVCDMCGTGFALKKTLETHLHTHTGARPHACDHCDATFAQPSAKYTHTKLVHSKFRSYE